MPVDAQLQPLLNLINSMPTLELGPESAPELRAQFEAMSAMLGTGPDVDVTDRVAPTDGGDIPLRVYRPHGAPSAELPAIVFFHGGGFVIGSIDTHDQDCRVLAHDAHCVVVSVEYRLAPEHPFPAAPDDCLAALRWVAEHAGELGVDASRLAVAGDSAGGNLAAVTALGWRDNGGRPLRLQVLVYPVTDMTPTVDNPVYPSILENAEGYYLDMTTMLWFEQQYLPRVEGVSVGSDPMASPQLAQDLGDLPPALVVTCEFDPLRDQGEAYAKRLADAGVAVNLSRYDGAIHGVFSMHQITAIGRRCMDEVVDAVRTAFV